MDINRILIAAADAGKIMLENGAEVYRVEETIERILSSYNISPVETFVTITVIMISALDENNKTLTIIKRMHGRTLDLEKINQVNNLSRCIVQMGLKVDLMEESIKNIYSILPYPNKINIIASGFMAAFFSSLFGGDIKDFLVTFVIGCLIKLTIIGLNSLKTNEFFINTLCGVITAVIALSTCHFGFTHSDKVIIGSIMLLVPGLAITNAIRDTIAGDLISGISRGIEAFLIAVAIAVGTGSVMKLWFFYFGGV